MKQDSCQTHLNRNPGWPPVKNRAPLSATGCLLPQEAGLMHPPGCQARAGNAEGFIFPSRRKQAKGMTEAMRDSTQRLRGHFSI